MTNNLLKEIKELDIDHDKVLEILKAYKKAEGEEEEEEEEEEEIEEVSTPVPKPKDQNLELAETLKILTKEVKELKNVSIKRKTPSKATKKREEEVPGSLTYTIQKNMFETDV